MEKCCVVKQMKKDLRYSSINCFCYICGKYENTTDSIKVSLSPNTFKLFFLKNGDCKIFVDETPYDIFEHESFMAFPNSRVVIKPDKDQPISFYWVEFGGIIADSLLMQTAFCRAKPFVGKINVPHFERFFEIPNSGFETPYAQFRAGGQIVVLLSYYIEHYPRLSTQNNTYVFEALNYIEQNIDSSDLSVKAVADYVKIDRTYLYRLVKDEIGIPLVEYINKSRVSRAEILLANRNSSVKDVAFSVGFSDPLYFSRVFKKYNGLTPTEYQRKSRNLV